MSRSRLADDAAYSFRKEVPTLKVLLVAEKQLTMEAIRDIGDTLCSGVECNLIQDPLFIFPGYLYDVCGDDDIVVYVPDNGKGYYHYKKEEIKEFGKFSNRKRSSISLFEEKIKNSQKGE